MIHKIIKKKQTKILILFLIPLTIIIQSCLTKILPAKYFYDSNIILTIVNHSRYETIYDNSYVFTARFFRNVNILHFTEFSQWAFCISSLAIVCMVMKLYKNERITVDKMIFVYLTIILQNIYVFRISKDIVQEILFILIDIIIINQHINNKYKVYIVFCVLIWEACVYRYYYYITAAFFILIYTMIRNIRRINILKVIAIFLVILCIGLIGLQKVDNSRYNELIYIRTKLNRNRDESPDAVTAINDVVKNNGNVFVYLFNYFINLMRVLFPIELIVKGIKYIPFIVYQMYITAKMIIILSKVKQREMEIKSTLLISVFISYLLVATLHEPDFGSFIRHESALAFIMFDLFISDKDDDKEITIQN